MKPNPRVIDASTTLQTLTGSRSCTQAAGSYQFRREIPAEDGCDLVVAGGGPAGCAAAIGAARLGLKVLLVEATGCLGGMGTSGLVAALDMSCLVGGFMRELVDAMYERGFMSPGRAPDWRESYFSWAPFQPEGLKLLLDELVLQAGVETRFFTTVIEADSDPARGTVSGVVLHNIEGCRYVSAPAFIDATGDAALAKLCGAVCREAGRDTPRIMPATLPALYAGADWSVPRGYEQDAYLAAALRDGHFTQPDPHLPGLVKSGERLGALNGGHLFNLDALRCRDLTDGMMWGRKIAQEYLSFYRRYVPGCADVELAATAALMGVRESRRVLGEYELTVGDYLARREFPDQIGVFNKFLDVHCYDNSEAEWQRHLSGREVFKAGEYFGLPYGILVPRGWRNLWVAGRCASSDVPVHGSIRVQPSASMMGQAAGVAAVQSLRTGQPACDLDTAELVQTLREQRAHLPQRETSPKMTRG